VLAIRNSLVLAALATLIAMLVGTTAALAAVQGGRSGRLMDGALMLPLGTSAVTLGLGLLLAFRSGPFAGRGTVLLVPLAQALVAIPFVVRTMLPVLRGIDDRLREAAATLGAPPRRVWHEVDLPIDAAVVLGTEREGLSDELRARAVLTVAIPMQDGVSSLNLATAAAVIAYRP
jgi:thiamine transport system permease protein